MVSIWFQLGLFMEEADDLDLVSSFLSTMFETGCDFTNGFRALSELQTDAYEITSSSREQCLQTLVGQCASINELMKSCKPTIPPG